MKRTSFLFRRVVFCSLLVIRSLPALSIALFGFAITLAFGQSTGSRPNQLPPETKPVIPPGDDVIIYIHGGPGSRLEEASDLVNPLLATALAKGKRYTVISFDQPSQGYSSMVDPHALVPPAVPQTQQPGPAPVQIPFPILASQDEHFPGSGGYMHTDVTISKNGDGTGSLHASTHTQEVTDFRGFRGAVAVALLDANRQLVWVSHTQNYGVDGRNVPFGKASDRTDSLDDIIPANLLQQARHIAIVQRWNPKNVFDDIKGFLNYIGDVGKELRGDLQTIATETGINPGPPSPARYYSLLGSSEQFIRGFLDQLNQSTGLYNHNIYMFGGSTGGALALRMGHLQDPWIKKIVAWNPASVWTSYASNILDPAAAVDPTKVPGDAGKAFALSVTFNSAEAPEQDNPNGPVRLTSRGGFFKSVYGPPVPTIQPNPEEWYRGDRKRYYPVGVPPYGGTPPSEEWSCKWQYIAASRLEMEEVYNPAYRRWHWRLGADMITFSFFNDDWYGPANTASSVPLPLPLPGQPLPAAFRSLIGGKPANYEGIIKPTLLVAGQDDDWDEGLGLHWENRWTQTRSMAALMKNTPGSTLFLLNTGHSVHNERPQFFSESIVNFLANSTYKLVSQQSLAHVQPSVPAPAREDPRGDEACQEPFDTSVGQPPQFAALPQQIAQKLLAEPDSATYLMQRANPGGNFSDGKDPGHYSLRLRPELRAIAQRKDPAFALGSAAASYYNGDNVMGNAYADLSVTGRAVYDAFRKHPPTDADIAALARNILSPFSMSRSIDEVKLANMVSSAKARAYQVAWALRNPDPAAGYKLRSDPALGWIAVSGQDDPPARPVNVPSGIPIYGRAPDGTPVQVSAYPQYEIPVTMCPSASPPYVAYACDPRTQGSVTFQIRYTIASLSSSQPGVVTAGPVITSVSPTRGPITGGTLVHVSLARSSASNASVSFGGVTPPQARCDNENCWFTTPANAKPGPVDIVVAAEGASPIMPRVSSKPSPFTYTPNAELAGFAHDSSSTDPAQYLVSLDGNAPVGGAIVDLKSNNPNVVAAPQAVTVRGFGAPVPLTIAPVPKDETVTVTAAYGGKSVSVGVLAPAWPPIRIDPANENVRFTTKANVTITLPTLAPSGGTSVALRWSGDLTAFSSPPPTSVIVPAGSYYTIFKVVASSPSVRNGVPVFKQIMLTATPANGTPVSITTSVPFPVLPPRLGGTNGTRQY